eukprot:g52657.t1
MSTPMLICFSCFPCAVACRFDRFTINRHGTNNVQARSGSLRSKANVKRIGHIVLVQSLWTNPVPLTRAWCLWEILCTFRTKSTFEIILPPKEEKSLLESPVTQEGFNSINTMLATVDVANAKAWKAEDQKKNTQGRCQDRRRNPWS